ncbi:MAG: hypothetical protein ACN4GW_10825 [Desulforhopalus sp.]
MKNSSILSPELIATIQAQIRIDWLGKHGARHWARVYEIGMRLSAKTGAHQQVIELFALFHDARRFNEHTDPQHGPRGAALARDLRPTFFPQLDEPEFSLLYLACSLHTSAASHSDMTVQTCFDADRLDLGRVGKVPDPQYLCTDAAKDSRILDWAYKKSVEGGIPDNILGNYFSQTL